MWIPMREKRLKVLPSSHFLEIDDSTHLWPDASIFGKAQAPGKRPILRKENLERALGRMQNSAVVSRGPDRRRS